MLVIRKCVSVFLSFVLLLLIITLHNNQLDYVKAAENDAIIISEETNVSGYLTPNTVVRYKFTAQSTGFYIVETAGSTDTYGIVRTHGSNPISYYDDDSGYSSNFCIGFYQEAGTYSNIYVRHHSLSTGSGPYTVRVRRQKAKIYTNKYSNLNTYPQETTPLIKTQQMGEEILLIESQLNHLGLIENTKNITDDNQIIIIKYNNLPTIVSVEKEITNLNGYDNVDILCHNMITGESINYSEFAEAKYI